MRLLTTATLALLVTVAVLAGGLRWLGTQRAPEGLPLPDAHGCWQSICFLDGRSFTGVLLALEANPSVPEASIRVPNGPVTTDYRIVYFQYGLRQYSAVNVMMYWFPYMYSFVPASGPTGPALRMGDVVAALGPPRRVIFTVNTLVLSYPERHVRVSVERSRRGRPWEVLSPDDPVIAFDVVLQEPDTMGAIYYVPNFAWRGFGAYQLEE